MQMLHGHEGVLTVRPEIAIKIVSNTTGVASVDDWFEVRIDFSQVRIYIVLYELLKCDTEVVFSFAVHPFLKFSVPESLQYSKFDVVWELD